MKKSTLIVIAIIAVLAVGGAVFAMTRDDSDDSATSSSTENTTASNTENSANSGDAADNAGVEASEVVIEDYAFVASTITVKAGTTVTWTNKDSVGHDVTPDSETDEFKQSDMLSKGESYSVTFNTPGTYSYHCSPHPYMKGTVVVTE